MLKAHVAQVLRQCYNVYADKLNKAAMTTVTMTKMCIETNWVKVSNASHRSNESHEGFKLMQCLTFGSSGDHFSIVQDGDHQACS